AMRFDARGKLGSQDFLSRIAHRGRARRAVLPPPHRALRRDPLMFEDSGCFAFNLPLHHEVQRLRVFSEPAARLVAGVQELHESIELRSERLRIRDMTSWVLLGISGGGDVPLWSLVL